MIENINLSTLPVWAKLEVTKADLEAFAQILLAQNKSHIPTPSVSAKKIMTLEELCAYIGAASQTVYGWVHQKKIPYHKHPTGRKLYFVQDEIDFWLTSNRRATSAEIEEQANQHIEEQKRKRRAKR